MAEQRRKRSFEVHRLVEYLVAVVLMSVFVNDRAERPVVGAAGAAVLLIAAATRGRLAVWRWLPLAAHRVADVVVAVAMVLATAIPGMGGLYVAQYLVPAALVQFWLVTRTDYRPRTTARGRAPKTTPRQNSRPAADSPTRTTVEARPAAAEEPGSDTAKNLGRLAGRMYAAARRAGRR